MKSTSRNRIWACIRISLQQISAQIDVVADLMTCIQGQLTQFRACGCSLLRIFIFNSATRLFAEFVVTSDRAVVHIVHRQLGRTSQYFMPAIRPGENRQGHDKQTTARHNRFPGTSTLLAVPNLMRPVSSTRNRIRQQNTVVGRHGHNVAHAGSGCASRSGSRTAPSAMPAAGNHIALTVTCRYGTVNFRVQFPVS